MIQRKIQMPWPLNPFQQVLAMRSARHLSGRHHLFFWVLNPQCCCLLQAVRGEPKAPFNAARRNLFPQEIAIPASHTLN